STISNNHSTLSGGGVYITDGSVLINNSTIANNDAANGGGVMNAGGNFVIKNSIIGNNSATTSAPDCFGTINTSSHNIISDTTGCTLSPGAGDHYNINPLIEISTKGSPPFYVLKSDSPAIDGGDNSTCLSTDQRGAARPYNSTCDIGAFEFKNESWLWVGSGSNQINMIGQALPTAISAYVYDSNSNPISGVTVTFSAPEAGPSGIFANTGTNTTSAITDSNGQATAALFTSNMQSGGYTIIANANGYGPFISYYLINRAGTIYVSPIGSDTNYCTSPTSPCLTINTGVKKAYNGDIVKVASGIYTATIEPEVVLIHSNITLSGGWNNTFNAQTSTSIINGQGKRRGVTIQSGIVAIDRFTIINGLNSGLVNLGDTLSINNSVIKNNSGDQGGGIYNLNGSVTIISSIISNNKALIGGGIFSSAGSVTINESSITKNESIYDGSGIAGKDVFINNATVSSNIGGKAIYILNGSIKLNNTTIGFNESYGLFVSGNATLQNTIIANNGLDEDCLIYSGSITSLGYNIIGNGTGCGITPKAGDKIGTSNSPINAGISANITGIEYHVLLPGSPAIDAGNPATCLMTDQRGMNRPQGAQCDIGAYEYVSNPGAVKYLKLIDGGNQERFLGQSFLKPLRVLVMDAQGTPITNTLIEFTAPSSGPSGTFSNTHLSTTSALTSSDGVATSALFTSNEESGTYSVVASLPNLSYHVEFILTNSTVINIKILEGNKQSILVGGQFPINLKVGIYDKQNNPINGIEIKFTAPSTGAGGNFAFATSKNINQDPLNFARSSGAASPIQNIYVATEETVNGIATAPPLRANFQGGTFTIIVSIPGYSDTATFSLENIPINSTPNHIRNSSFEDPIPGNYWSMYSAIFETPLCTLSICGSGAGTAGPHSGNTWVWFGGVPAPYSEDAYITQSVIIPEGSPHLRFYLWIGYAEFGSVTNDKLTVAIDYVPVFSANAWEQSQYSSYKLVDIDLGQFADGRSHYINFTSQTSQKIVNFNVDDISINSSTFGDVYPDYWSWLYIERLYGAGITSGCTTSPLTFCPADPVTRAQMAVFLLKGLHGSSYSPPSVGTSTEFGDVSTSHWAAAWIKQLATEAITGGCGSGIYCPENTVTRAQMAVFLLKAMHGSSYSPPNVTATFGDTSGHWAEDWIEQLATEGITSGCGGGNYCPENPVTRDQMAVFL
ncbi:MAG TPA: choice-of-anchor Q domain-containing protein, partial [Chitinophagales bacterium]|nr:choice-of-anchor Q domain-containing protein [Chitinophagales bacterium]